MTAQHREIIDCIRSSAEAIRRAVATVPPGRHAESPRAGEWSALETLAHLRNVLVMVHGLRIRRLAYETDPVFADYDEPAYRRTTLGQGESASDLLEMAVLEHEQLARLLATLPDGDWQRTGRHPELGAMSIEFLARRVAEHGEEHAAQIAESARLLALVAADVSEPGCVFCGLVAELRRAERCPNPGAPDQVYRRLAELPASIAILAPDQYYRGYTLVVAKTHAAELFQLPEAESAQYYQDMLRVARAVAAAFEPRKLNYELLGNTVPHLHWHLLPRYADDPHPLRPTWEHAHAPRLVSEAAYEETLAALRRHIG